MKTLLVYLNFMTKLNYNLSIALNNYIILKGETCKGNSDVLVVLKASCISNSIYRKCDQNKRSLQERAQHSEI